MTVVEHDRHPTPLPLRARNAILRLARNWKFSILPSLAATLTTYMVVTPRPASVRPLELTPAEARSVETDVAKNNAVVFTVTWYGGGPNDVRLRMCLNTVRECRKRSLPVIIVDDSPSEEIRSSLRDAGAIVRRQTVRGGDKGVAFREAATLAGSLPGVTKDTFLCWQEAEKTDMVRHWTRILSGDGGGPRADVVYPRRNPESFRDTYPIEQYHEETLGNLYLDAIAAGRLGNLGLDLPTVDFDLDDGGGTGTTTRTFRLDWYFGPFGFRAEHSRLWTEYRGGDSYDAQVVPVVHVLRKGLKISSREVDYRAPSEMRTQEEGDVAFIEKRLRQLDFLHPKVKAAWTESFY